MKIFVESIDQGIWYAIENDPFIPKIKKNGSFIKKPWSQWTNEECKMTKLDCIAQNIIASALDSNDFSGYQNANLLRKCGTYSKLLMETSLNKRKQRQEVKQEEKGGKIEKSSTSSSWPKRKMIQAV